LGDEWRCSYKSEKQQSVEKEGRSEKRKERDTVLKLQVLKSLTADLSLD
jgi:hypothetical protein